MQAPKHFDKLKPEPGPKPGPTRKAWSDLQLCIGMKSRIVESCKWLIFLKQGHLVLISPRWSPAQKECETNPSGEQKNAAMFATRISWSKITITSIAVEHNDCTSQKKKTLLLML